jgi:hypothetical protein
MDAAAVLRIPAINPTQRPGKPAQLPRSRSVAMSALLLLLLLLVCLEWSVPKHLHGHCTQQELLNTM